MSRPPRVFVAAALQNNSAPASDRLPPSYASRRRRLGRPAARGRRPHSPCSMVVLVGPAPATFAGENREAHPVRLLSEGLRPHHREPPWVRAGAYDPAVRGTDLLGAAPGLPALSARGGAGPRAGTAAGYGRAPADAGRPGSHRRAGRA